MLKIALKPDIVFIGNIPYQNTDRKRTGESFLEKKSASIVDVIGFRWLLADALISRRQFVTIQLV